jgi:hypothetical protein
MNPKPRAKRTQARKAADDAGSLEATQADGNVGDPEFARIERLYDAPQSEWGVDEWRGLATYLMGQVGRLTELVNSATNTAAGALQTARHLRPGWLIARWLDQQVQLGRIDPVAKDRRKRAGRKKKRSAEEERSRNLLLAALAARLGPTGAARRVARLKLEEQGTSPDSVAGTTKLGQYQRTLANQISKARKALRQEILLEHGQSPTAQGLLQQLNLTTTRARRKSPKNSG